MKGKNILVPIIFVALLLVGTYFYIMQNIIMASIVTVFIILLYYKTRKPHYDILPDEENKVYIFLLSVSAILLAFRFYRILSFPYDYFEDELTDIVDTYTKIFGGRDFFSYVNRQGAALPLVPEIIYSLFLFIVGYHIEFFRIIPLFLVVITAIELYYLGKILRNSSLGIILFFLYSVSCWTLFTAREFIANGFIPFFCVSFLLLFFLYTKKNDIKFFLLAWVVFFAGFFSYTSWLLMTPFAIYLLYEYRKELGEKRIKLAAVFIAVSIGAAALALALNKSIITWSISRTNLNNSDNIIVRLALNIMHLPGFFMLPIKDSVWFTDKLTILSFTEFLLLLGGIILCLVRIRDRLYRIFFIGFCISLFTLLISSGTPPRHIMTLPFLIIISGIFLQTFIRWRYSIFIMTMSVLFFINTAFYMFFEWNDEIRTDKRDIRISEYINKNYQNKDYLFMYTTIPLSALIGEYSAFLHTRIAYEKISEERINRALFISSSLLRYQVRNIFPDIKMKYFYDYDNKNKLPIVLYDLDLSKDISLKKFFIEMSKQIDETNRSFWALDYDNVIKECEEYCEKTDKDPLIILKNTFLRYTQLKALNMLNRNDEMAAVLFGKEKPMFLTSDWSLMIAQSYYMAGDVKDTIIFLQKAAKDAPEWDDPKQALQTITAQGIHP